MASIEVFKSMFAGADLDIEDIFLLEAFQIDYLPGWVPENELCVVLHERPEIGRYLRRKNPEISGFLNRVEQRVPKGGWGEAYEKSCAAVVWTIADLLIYNKCPEVYDQLPFHGWDFREVTSLVDLDARLVVDAGAGTGRVALEAARTAGIVYAVEPVARLRRYIREKASIAGLDNLYTVDGFLDQLPFPDDYADVLITSHALGWRLEHELLEFERVVMPGGFVIHCPGTAETDSEEGQHQSLLSPPWDYSWARYQEADGWKRKYWKAV